MILKAVDTLNRNEKCDRLIVITDEQAHDNVPAPSGKGYLINVARYRNGSATASGCTSMAGARRSSNTSARWSRRRGELRIVLGGQPSLARTNPRDSIPKLSA